MEAVLVAATLFFLIHFIQGGFMEMVAVGKYKPKSLVVLLLDKRTREIVMEQQIHIGNKALCSVCTGKNANHTVYRLNKFGFCEYDDAGNEYIIRYELTK